MGGRGPRGQMSFEERLSDLRWRQTNLTGALFAVRKPTVAALPGAAAGAGLAIALACDIRIAAKSAFCATGYARDRPVGRLRHRLAADPRGRLDAGARADAHRRAGRCRAQRAHRPGQPRGRRRQAAGRGLRARQVAGRGSARRLPQHQGQSRRGACTSTTRPRCTARPSAWSRASRTADHKEAVAAFVEKRKPVFSGRRARWTASARRALLPLMKRAGCTRSMIRPAPRACRGCCRRTGRSAPRAPSRGRRGCRARP